MASKAPTLDQPFSTPSHEWANEITSALHLPPVSDIKQPSSNITMSSGTSTPGGPPFPGAYPGGEESAAGALRPLTGEGSVSMIDTAKQYIPGQEDVTKAFQSAGDTVKPYLPAAVASYLPGNGAPNDKSLASNGSTTNDGSSGDFPGSGLHKQQDSGSAGLPASPATGETTTAFGTSHDTAADGTGQTGGLAASNIGARELGDSKREMGKEEISGDSDKSKPRVSAKELINKKKEMDEEESQSLGASKPVNPTPRTTSTDEVPTRLGQSAQQFVCTPTSSTVATKSSSIDSGVPTPPAKDVRESRQGGVKGSSQGYDTGYHPAEIHPTNGNYPHSANGSKTESADMDASHKRTGSTATNSSGTNSVGGSPRKVSLRNKIVGEAKVLAGKIGKKEEKVAEGRRILQGEV